MPDFPRHPRTTQAAAQLAKAGRVDHQAAPPKPKAPTKGDAHFRADLERDAETFHRVLTVLSSDDLADKAERLLRVLDQLGRYDVHGDTVLDRIRLNLNNGMKAQHYGPRGSVRDQGDVDEIPPEKAMEQMFPPDRARADLKTLTTCAHNLNHAARLLDIASRYGQPAYPASLDLKLNYALKGLETILTSYPPAHRSDPSDLRKLERENVRAAPDCPSCLRIGWQWPCKEGINGNGYTTVASVCEFCERWAKKDPDPDPSVPRTLKNKPAWPLIYAVVQHYRAEELGGPDKARLLAEDHSDRREMEAWAKAHRAKGAA